MKKSSEKVSYQSGTVQLSGVLHRHEGKPPVATVILVHGIINNKDEDGNFVALAEGLSKKGYEVFRFDFRGHGESEGRSEDVTIAGELQDLRTSIEKADKLSGTKLPLIIVASSFGAVTSILYTASNAQRVAKLVLWNPVLDFRKTFLEAETPWGKTFFNADGYAELRAKGYITVPQTNFRFGRALIAEFDQIKPYRVLQDIKLPVLTVHGTEDTAVPYSVSKEYGTPNALSAFITHRCDHSFVGIEPIVIRETIDWITRRTGDKR
jgi:alpha-beta hydrolase superfamily lysophospholipase